MLPAYLQKYLGLIDLLVDHLVREIEEESTGLMVNPPNPDPEPVMTILSQAKKLAREYYMLTGRPLGVTGEVAEFEAVRLLGLELTGPLDTMRLDWPTAVGSRSKVGASCCAPGIDGRGFQRIRDLRGRSRTRDCSAQCAGITLAQ